MHAAILRYGILLALAALGTSTATAQTELFFATGVDSTGWAQAQSNVDGHVLIESPQYPRGLWLHLVDEGGDALAGIQVEYQGRPDSLVAIYCVDPAGGVRETLIWTRPHGTPLSLMLKPKEVGNLPAGLIPIDWRIDPTAEALLEPMAETWRINWEEMAAFLQARWQGQTGRIAVQIESSTTSTTWAVEVLHEGVIFYRLLFADANLESAVRETLGRPQGRLTPEDVASLRTLNFHDKDIHSLAGIEYLTALQGLSLRWNQIVDLTPLKRSTSLRNLYLGGNQIVDLTPLKQLTSLKRLGLSRNQIVDLAPLKQLTFLRELALDDNQIVDITSLKQLTNLQELALGGNQIVDLTPLKQLTNLARASPRRQPDSRSDPDKAIDQPARASSGQEPDSRPDPDKAIDQLAVAIPGRQPDSRSDPAKAIDQPARARSEQEPDSRSGPAKAIDQPARTMAWGQPD